MDKHLYLEYLNSVTNFLERNYVDKLVSIILFGSLVNKEKTLIKATDVDLLVIMRDTCSSTDFKMLKRSLFKLESRLFSHLRGHESLFLKGLQNATGMFCNFFVCRLSDFKKRNFNLVFGVNSIMGTLLAPQNSVWLSLLRQHQIIWGENVFKEWKTPPSITKRDLIRSFLMNWLLATGALVLYPFYTQIAKFSMEAMKWSLFTWRNFHHQPISTLTQTITRFGEYASTMELRALRSFMEYRKNGKTGDYFTILAWIFIFQLHRSLFRHSYG
ncbi:MAG: hypothetical protein ACXADY_05950 [Candidatus Hodarchaeales archaeon]|jgi:predicted nucleotidyltransferase